MPTSFSHIPNMFPCRLCGKEEVDEENDYLLCRACEKKVKDYELTKTLKEIMPKDDIHCQTCFSHMAACRCPQRQILDDLDK